MLTAALSSYTQDFADPFSEDDKRGASAFSSDLEFTSRESHFSPAGINRRRQKRAVQGVTAAGV